jgi:hypothetical protein
MYFTRFGDVDSGDALNERAFTGAIITNQSGDLSSVCIKVNVFKYMYRTE